MGIEQADFQVNAATSACNADLKSEFVVPRWRRPVDRSHGSARSYGRDIDPVPRPTDDSPTPNTGPASDWGGSARTN